MDKAVICLGVGGTNVDAALVTEEGKVVSNVDSVRSPSNEDFNTVIEVFEALVNEVAKSRDMKTDIIGCSIGMPNPFDYENGISFMRHKFTSLYKRNIKLSLEEALRIPICFLNDADAFALGAYWRQAPQAKRLIGLTLGTGLGSGFIEEGNIVTNDKNVPPSGEIWNFPYGEGILEDYISGRGIESLYLDLSGHRKSPKEIEDLARQGDAKAEEVYQKMGETLGFGLANACRNFEPDIVIVGGKIGRATDLFLDKAAKSFHEKTGYITKFMRAENELMALYGSAKYAFSRQT